MGSAAGNGSKGDGIRKRRLLRKLRSKYRLLLINEKTFEERFSVRLSRLNVLLLVVLSLVLYGALITALIVYTPLKQYIPGYSDQDTKRNAYNSMLLADSLANKLMVRDWYLENLRNVLSGELPVDSTTLFAKLENKPNTTDLAPGRVDSLLRARLSGEEAYDLQDRRGSGERRELAGVFFFPPLRGLVTSGFDRAQGRFGIDIVSGTDAAVKASLDGTVVMASWTTDAGHVLQLQHRNDLVSVYKHNGALLKKVGDRVKAGEAIAIVGNSGEQSTGPHLHFELWLNGEPVDPQAYMVFQ